MPEKNRHLCVCSPHLSEAALLVLMPYFEQTWIWEPRYRATFILTPNYDTGFSACIGGNLLKIFNYYILQIYNPNVVHVESFLPIICYIRYTFQIRLRFFCFGQCYQLVMLHKENITNSSVYFGLDRWCRYQ